MNGKSIFASKTFYLNAIGITMAILEITSPDMIGVNPAHLMWAMGVLNIFNRFLTKGPVTLTGGDNGS